MVKDLKAYLRTCRDWMVKDLKAYLQRCGGRVNGKKAGLIKRYMYSVYFKTLRNAGFKY